MGEVKQMYLHTDRCESEGHISCRLYTQADMDALRAQLETSQSMEKRWKAAVEGLTPHGSEYVNDPEACAAAIRERTRYPKQIIELRAQLEAATKERDEAKRVLAGMCLTTESVTAQAWAHADSAVAAERKRIVERVEGMRDEWYADRDTAKADAADEILAEITKGV